MNWYDHDEGYASYLIKYRESIMSEGNSITENITIRKPETRGLMKQVEDKETHLQKVLNERAARYGKFADNASMAQVMKENFREQPIWDSLSLDKREALDNIAQKIARILTGRNAEYKDSWTDIAGYATLVADTLKE